MPETAESVIVFITAVNGNMERNMRKRGSLTVEAAFCFPLFFFAILALSYLFFYLRIEYQLQRDMYTAAQEISVYGDIIKPLRQKIQTKSDDIQQELMGKSNGRNTVQNLLTEISDGIVKYIPGTEQMNLQSLVFGTADKAIVGFWVRQYIQENIYGYIVDGEKGLDFSGSVLMDSGDCIQIVCSYKLKLPFGLFGDLGISVRQELKYRYFTGIKKNLLIEVVDELEVTPTPGETPISEETPIPEGTPTPVVTPTPKVTHIPEESPVPSEPYLTGTAPTGINPDDNVQNDEEKDDEKQEDDNDHSVVLITETGRVYHYTYLCPNLKVKPESVLFNEVADKRNDGGGKYYPCEHCIRNKVEMTICYITSDGDRYHIRLDCPGLKRTISEVLLDDVGKRHECKRCKAYRDEWIRNGRRPLN